jgi:hypothetical protein
VNRNGTMRPPAKASTVSTKSGRPRVIFIDAPYYWRDQVPGENSIPGGNSITGEEQENQHIYSGVICEPISHFSRNAPGLETPPPAEIRQQRFVEGLMLPASRHYSGIRSWHVSDRQRPMLRILQKRRYPVCARTPATPGLCAP